VQQIDKGFFSIEVPLPGNPLKALNAYLIKGERSLLIDTGFDLDVCEDAVRRALSEAEVDISTLDVLLTHFHSDHVGLLQRLLTPEMKVFCGIPPWQTNRFWAQFTTSDNMIWLKQCGLDLQELSERDLQTTLKAPEFKISWTHIRDMCEYQILGDRDELAYGDYRLQIVQTDGHCAGHICLYEPERKFLIAGDHILGHISPNIICFNIGELSSLRKYLNNLDKVAEMDVVVIYPGHREIVRDPGGRITELKQHHCDRLEEVRSIIGTDSLMGVDVASRMRWTIKEKGWKNIPLTQKYFALGEAMAHINYLKEEGELVFEEIDGVNFYRRTRENI
jgi:glyoxylase-like metal-dependent hydrolase (beta-lactamase superfamily II)